MDRLLTRFIIGWSCLAWGVNALCIGATVWLAPTWSTGVSTVMDVFSPFNVVNVFAELILFSPALAAVWWRERRRATA